MQPVAPGLCQRYARSLAVPGECLAALLAPPAGWQPLGIPVCTGGPLRGTQLGPSWPAEGLVCSWWSPAYARGMPAPQRCPVNSWRRFWPLLRGGGPWDTRSCWRC